MNNNNDIAILINNQNKMLGLIFLAVLFSGGAVVSFSVGAFLLVVLAILGIVMLFVVYIVIKAYKEFLVNYVLPGIMSVPLLWIAILFINSGFINAGFERGFYKNRPESVESALLLATALAILVQVVLFIKNITKGDQKPKQIPTDVEQKFQKEETALATIFYNERQISKEQQLLKLTVTNQDTEPSGLSVNDQYKWVIVLLFGFVVAPLVACIFI